MDIRPTAKRLPVLATVLAIAFAAVSLTTAASHCLDACRDCASGHLAEVATAGESPRHIESASSDPAHRCPGPLCLCHHHPLMSGSFEVSASITVSDGREAPPTTPAAGVAREILHIPKNLS